MPMRNAAPYVAEAVESVLAQSFGDFELLIFDDGSEDDSCAIAKRYAKEDPRIVLHQGSQAGMAVWLREGVLRARAELIARVDADDVAPRERFAHQVQYMDEHPECVALAGDALIVDPERRPIRRHRVPREHEEIERWLWQLRGPLPSPMLRRRAVLQAGNYRTDRGFTEDSDLYLRLAEIGRLANLPEIALEYRKHERAVGVAHRLERSAMRNRMRAEALRRRGLPETALPVLPERPDVGTHDLWHEWARAALAEGYLATARHYARALLRAEPLAPRSWLLLLRAVLGLRLSRTRHPTDLDA
jgi:glycosyltransferase involved in cell wall biosynthesis